VAVAILSMMVSSQGVPLRIMPLGASVTFGTGSSTGNSYRKDLRDLLVAANQTVNMVGSTKNGNFTDNDVEATPGFVIYQIAASAAASIPINLPNLVLVDAGTNNCNNGGTVPDAGANVTAMINDIYAKSPGTTVILTSILANKIAAQDACRVDINAQYASIVAQLQQSGAKLVTVDMRSAAAPTVNDLADTRHPNDVGYQKMANVWFAGIQEAMSKGFITAAADNGIPADGGA
jgi:lysophospholipase L1-like esterase